MPCIPIPGGIICVNRGYRLRLLDGRYLYMEWHHFCGPTFYEDRAWAREIPLWWNDPIICRAVEWFCDRGHRA